MIGQLSWTTAFLAVVAQAEITPDDYPQFRINMDEDIGVRYFHVFERFEEEIKEMQDYWWDFLGKLDGVQEFYRDNMDELCLAQPEACAFAESLAEFLGKDTSKVQVFAVSNITEVSTYCTSIVARNSSGEIAHVRNLDFGDWETMKKLVFDAILYKNGEEVAQAPSIAGFYGVFTGHKTDKFSLTYNVRERESGLTPEAIMGNLKRNLDPNRMVQGAAMQHVLLNIETYEEAVEFLATAPMTSPSHFTVGGTSENQGVVLSRDEDTTDHRYELSEDNWYVAMTNLDTWSVIDSRYVAAVAALDHMGQEAVTTDGKAIVENVLWNKGVIKYDTIFSSVQSASRPTVDIYNAPNKADLFLQ